MSMIQAAESLMCSEQEVHIIDRPRLDAEMSARVTPLVTISDDELIRVAHEKAQETMVRRVDKDEV